MTREATAGKGDVILLVGTRKGAFILSSSQDRKDWSLSGPHSAGGDVFHMAYDPRTGATLAATNQLIWASNIEISSDLDKT